VVENNQAIQTTAEIKKELELRRLAELMGPGANMMTSMPMNTHVNATN
jgi:hypothetical protein